MKLNAKMILSLSLLVANTQLKAQENLSAERHDDPYLWLEEVDGEKALEFVQKQNKLTETKFTALPDYQGIYDKVLKIANSTDRIAYPTVYGTYIYNFWQDKEHVRGIWRRTSKAAYLSGKPEWETVLDIDALAEKDKIKWVFKGAVGLYPTYDRFLVNLSNGGGDAVVIKEFDAKTKTFITGGFELAEAKGDASYWDENTLIISTDFGPGTMTTSGYARQVKLWKRGTDIKQAKLLFEGNETDVASFGYKMIDGDKSYLMAGHSTTFYTGFSYVMVNEKLVKLDLPEDISISGILNDQLILQLKSDWEVNGKKYTQGSLLSANFSQLLKGTKELQEIFKPNATTSISGVSFTQNTLLLNVLSNVKNELYVYSLNQGKWDKKKVPAPDFGTISVLGGDHKSDDYFLSFQNFLTPSTLYTADALANTIQPVKSLPAFFDASKYVVEQFMAKSTDGTQIPYFVIRSRNMAYNSANPTLLYGYGGFEVSLEPFYSASIGQSWLENGGVYVLANIRGGGEYGPAWHQAGLKEKRQHVYDDFHAIAQDLITKKITSSKNLGIKGGSNGGLLMGVAFTQRPDLYNAVVCQVPLLDMQRYNKLLAGASWMGEYGNPDVPEEWAFISKYSPYHNLKKGVTYPEVFFTTSTRDDRVHPAHARKMVAKMLDMGYPVYYYENMEGGHAGSSTNEQYAHAAAMEYAYLLLKLKH